MPEPVRYVPRPFVRESYTPDNTTLLKLMQMAGQAQQDATLQRGQTKGQGLMNLGHIISQALGNWRQEGEQKQAFQARQQFEQQKLEEANQIKREEMAARAEERGLVEQQRQEVLARQGQQDTRQTAMDLAANMQPGVIDPRNADALRAYPGTAGRVQVQDGAPVLMRTPQQAEQARAATVAQQTSAAAAARQAATDTRLTGMAAEAARHNQAMERRPVGGGSEPSLQTREVVNDKGQTVMANFNPKTGKWTQSDGTVIANPKPTAGTEKASSGVQKRVLNFFNRAEQADKDLENLEPWLQGLGTMGQARLEHAPNLAQTPEGRKYTQAQRAFTEARLRKDSGAAIPDHEFASDRLTYFPQTGDDAGTLAQKRRARATMLASLAFESGQALGEFLGSAEEATATIESYKNRASDPKAPLKSGQTVKVGGFTVTVKP